MKAINIEFTIETLEDFHIGTGLDCAGLYDDGQVKDSSGNPAIRPETLKGLLKQSCLEVKRNLKGYDDAFNELFYFKNLGSLDLFIEYKGCESNNPFIIHTFTAIDKKTGTGKKGSLRDIEFGSKGCKFDCKLHFELKNDIQYEKVKKLIEFGIKNLKWMGTSRRRGFGEIKCKNVNDYNIKLKPKPIISDEKFRVFLELQDDVCIAGAGQTGNIIHTLDYISGTTALGMLRNPLLKMNKSTDIMDDGNISVTNFYPIGKEWNNDLKTKMVIPVPSSLRKNKGVDQFEEYYRDKRNNDDILEIPYWALDAKPTKGNKKSFKNIVSQDTLIDDNNTDQDGASDKSISGEYLVFDDNKLNWENAKFFKPKKNLIMRNRITESTQSTDDDGIFTQEMIEKGTVFVGEISFDSNAISAVNNSNNLDQKNDKTTFKPIVIKKKVNDKKIEVKVFSVTLFSDVILYDDKLMPETVIHPKYLGFDGEIKLINSISSTRIHQSFSGLAGLRRFSDRVISKGSCFLYELKDKAKWDNVKKKLEELPNKIGFKTDEGFGQIIINLSVHQIGKMKNANFAYELENPELPKFQIKELIQNEELLIKAEELKKKHSISSSTFINRIIGYMEAKKSEEFLTEKIEHGKTTSSEKHWNLFKNLFNDSILNNKSKDEKYTIIRLAYLMMK